MNAKRIAIKELKDNGYIFERHGGNHDMYRNEELRCSIPVRHHFTDDDLKVIRNEIKENRRRRS